MTSEAQDTALTPAEFIRVLLKFSAYPSSVVLILMNLIPLAGAIFWRWDIFFMIFLYWTENVMVWFFTSWKILLVGKEKKQATLKTFVMQYGYFTAAHFIFMISLFTFRPVEFPAEAPWAVGSLFLSHLFSFWYNFFWKKQILRDESNAEMIMALGNIRFSLDPTSPYFLTPYPRMVIMHGTVVFGCFFAVLFGAPVIAMIIFVLLKIVADLLGHLIEHHESAGIPVIALAVGKRRKVMQKLKRRDNDG